MKGTRELPTDESDPNAAMVRSFGDQLADINSGAVADQAALQLADLVQQVMKTGRKGSVTVTIIVAPYKGNSRTVEVAATTTLKRPAGDPHAGVFFTDPSGHLFRHDPSQPTFDMVLAETPRPGAERPLA